MMMGFSPSVTATTEFVVPKSIPIVFAITILQIDYRFNYDLHNETLFNIILERVFVKFI
jgi:hypothetical protein